MFPINILGNCSPLSLPFFNVQVVVISVIRLSNHNSLSFVQLSHLGIDKVKAGLRNPDLSQGLVQVEQLRSLVQLGPLAHPPGVMETGNL